MGNRCRVFRIAFLTCAVSVAGGWADVRLPRPRTRTRRPPATSRVRRAARSGRRCRRCSSSTSTVAARSIWIAQRQGRAGRHLGLVVRALYGRDAAAGRHGRPTQEERCRDHRGLGRRGQRQRADLPELAAELVFDLAHESEGRSCRRCCSPARCRARTSWTRRGSSVTSTKASNAATSRSSRSGSWRWPRRLLERRRIAVWDGPRAFAARDRDGARGHVRPSRQQRPGERLPVRVHGRPAHRAHALRLSDDSDHHQHLRRQDRRQRGRALALATLYVAGIAFMFGALGTVFALLGKAFGDLPRQSVGHRAARAVLRADGGCRCSARSSWRCRRAAGSPGPSSAARASAARS